MAIYELRPSKSLAARAAVTSAVDGPGSSTRELGIRFALGATKSDVTRLVLRQALTTATAGLILGLLLAVGIGRMVSSLLYRVSPLDAVALIAAVLVLGVTTLVACYVPVRRATRIAPLDALRTE